MQAQRELELVEQMLRQLRPSTGTVYQRLCWERGFLASFLASVAHADPRVRRLIDAKMLKKI